MMRKPLRPQTGSFDSRTFTSVADAMRAGFGIYDTRLTGYLVRTRTINGWVYAEVILK